MRSVFTRGGLLYVSCVIAAGAVTLLWRFPQSVPDIGLFIGLLLASSLASSHRLRLPLGANSSTLSVSYATDFAALFLIGTDLTMVVAAASAFVQSTVVAPHGPSKKNPPVRVAFNVAALVLTVQTAGAAVHAFGPTRSMPLVELAQPMVAGALAYYLVNTGPVAAAIALTARERVWKVWESNFLWTAPSYFVGAGAAVAAVAIWNADRGWLLPLVIAPVYLTFRSYAIYVDRLASDQRHNQEVMRLHNDAVAALGAARRSEQRYALAAAGSNDGLWDWDIDEGALYCSERWKLMLGLSPQTAVATIGQWVALVHEDDCAGLEAALDAHLRGDTAHFEHEDPCAPFRRADSLGPVPRHRRPRRQRPPDPHGRLADRRDRMASGAGHARHRGAPRRPHGLPNRRLFGELLQRSMARTARAPTPRYAVLFIDLDGFKLVNDSLGHLVGDQFLVAISVAARRRQLRPSDVLSRLGGDEFAVLVEDFASPDEVCLITERLQRSLGDPIRLQRPRALRLGEHRRRASAARTTTPWTICCATPTSRCIAPRRPGRGGYQIFDPHMHARRWSG